MKCLDIFIRCFLNPTSLEIYSQFLINVYRLPGTSHLLIVKYLWIPTHKPFQLLEKWLYPTTSTNIWGKYQIAWNENWSLHSLKWCNYLDSLFSLALLLSFNEKQSQENSSMAFTLCRIYCSVDKRNAQLYSTVVFHSWQNRTSYSRFH